MQNAPLRISMESDPSPADLAVVRDGLWAYNFAATGKRDVLRFAAFLRDGEGRIFGGATGFSLWGWMHLMDLWVDEKARGQRHGSALLQKVEEEGRARQCRGVLLDTFSFQARPFYEKHGYHVFAEIADCPPGASRYYMTKPIALADGEG